MSWRRLSTALFIVQGRRSLLGARAFATGCTSSSRFFCRAARLNSFGVKLPRLNVKMMSSTRTTGAVGKPGSNRLIGETSPYLLQHAHNPVDWMPWGEEAFRKAREEDKPIFLSVGYSTCHWCHVMERESFESEAVAKVLNSKFVSIKVDREERPDVDQCFMTFVQATSGGGGWPMSVWLTPDLKPFVGATYFPEQRFIRVLDTLADNWSTNREEVIKQGNHIIRLLQERLTTIAATGGDPETFLSLPKSREAVREGFSVLDKGHDDDLGGWSGGRGGMKFPQPSRMNLLLRVHYSEGGSSDLGKRALGMVETTLMAMARGGVYDHIFDGFARYSTDPRWHVPHFEKMLYDQSQLVTSYVEAFQVTGNSAYADVARGVLRYVLRDMTDAQGGFYSAEDADSLPFEGASQKKEGAFCVWTEPDLRKIVDEGDERLPTTAGGGIDVPISHLFSRVYGVRPEGNCDPSGDVHGELLNQNCLFKAASIKEASDALQLTCSQERAEAAMDKAMARLMTARRKRPAPSLDDKVITSWNGLMISALARASQAFSSPPRGEESLLYLRAAERAAEFLRDNLYRLDGGGGRPGPLLRSWRNGRSSSVHGFADDYAFLIRGLIDLYEADPRQETGGRWLRWAKNLQVEMDKGFACLPKDGGGYYSSRAVVEESTSDDASNVSGSLPLRLKYGGKSFKHGYGPQLDNSRCQETDYDGAEPGAGSVAADNLLRLSGYFGGEEGRGFRRRAAEQLAAAFAMPETPQAYPELTASLVTGILGPKQVIITGDPDAADTQALISAAQRAFCPNLVLILAPSRVSSSDGEQQADLENEQLQQDNQGIDESGGVLFTEILDTYGDVYETEEDGAAAAYVCFEKSCSRPVRSAEELSMLLKTANRK